MVSLFLSTSDSFKCVWQLTWLHRTNSLPLSLSLTHTHTSTHTQTHSHSSLTLTNNTHILSLSDTHIQTHVIHPHTFTQTHTYTHSLFSLSHTHIFQAYKCCYLSSQWNSWYSKPVGCVILDIILIFFHNSEMDLLANRDHSSLLLLLLLL